MVPAALKFIPGGRVPETTDQVNGAAPPACVSVAEYPGCPFVAKGNAVVVILSNATDIEITFVVMIICGLPESFTWIVNEDDPSAVGVPVSVRMFPVANAS